VCAVYYIWHLHYAASCFTMYLCPCVRTCVVQTAEVQLRDAKERLLEQDNRIAEQTKLIAEFTLKVRMHVCTHIRAHVSTRTYIHV